MRWSCCPQLGRKPAGTTLLVSETNLTTYEAADSNHGDFYILSFSVPAEAKPVGRVYLEFYVDVEARAVNGYTNDTPVIEVYALKSAFAGTLDPTKFETGVLRMVKNVPIGENRRVVLDITEIAKSYAANSLANYGIVIGSLTGSRDGLFTVRSDAFDGDTVCKITFLK